MVISKVWHSSKLILEGVLTSAQWKQEVGIASQHPVRIVYDLSALMVRGPSRSSASLIKCMWENLNESFQYLLLTMCFHANPPFRSFQVWGTNHSSFPHEHASYPKLSLVLAVTDSGFREGKLKHPNWNITCRILVPSFMLNCIKDLGGQKKYICIIQIYSFIYYTNYIYSFHWYGTFEVNGQVSVTPGGSCFVEADNGKMAILYPLHLMETIGIAIAQCMWDKKQQFC